MSLTFNTIEQSWKQVEAQMLPSGISAVQRRECKRMFYADAASMLDTLTHVIGSDETSEAAGVQIIEGLLQEAHAFAQYIKEGRA